MRLSIVTINFNNAEGLRKTLASVASQTYRDIEHIIVDGGSTDDSVDVIKEYENTIKQSVTIDKSTIQVKWISEPDNGIYNGMNKGIKRATGDYVWILNSGDCAANVDVVERMVDALRLKNEDLRLKNEGEVSILMGNIVHVYEKGKAMRGKKRTKTNDLTPRPIEASMLTFYSGTIPHDAAFVRRDLFEQFGYFDETMKICADWKLYLDMIALGGVEPMYVDIDVVLFDMSGVSNTNNERRLAERRAYLENVLHPSILKDYDRYSGDIMLMQRLHRHPWAYRLTWFLERILFKIEKLKKC